MSTTPNPHPLTLGRPLLVQSYSQPANALPEQPPPHSKRGALRGGRNGGTYPSYPRGRGSPYRGGMLQQFHPSSGARSEGSLNATTQARAPLLHTDQSWTLWVELGVSISDLPPHATTLDLYKRFSREGSIMSIEIFENNQGVRNGRARIRFRPPPAKPFWLESGGKCHCSFGGDVFPLRITLDEKRRNFIAPSPVDPRHKYPEKLLQSMDSVSFGFMHETDKMMVMHESTSSGNHPVDFEVDLLRRRIEIRFQLNITDPRKWDRRSSRPMDLNECNRTDAFSFHLPFPQIRRICEVKLGDRNRGFLITLEAPPNFYRHASGVENTHIEGSLFWGDWETWYRQTDVVYDPRMLKKSALNLNRSIKPLVDIGRWTTYLFTFDTTRVSRPRYEELCKALKDFNLELVNTPSFTTLVQHGQYQTLWQWIDKGPPKPPHLRSSFLQDMEEMAAVPLSFPVRYQLEVCISQGFLEEHSLDRQFIDRLAQLQENRALDLLEEVADKKRRIYQPMDVFNMRISKRSSARLKIPYYCANSRSAVVTPTMIYYNSPSVEISNRVVRRYIEHADRFLRVRFTEEKPRDRIFATDKPKDDELFTRIKRTLVNGIRIGDRHFEFLAFGNSQFREHGAYFFAATPHLNAAMIRRWMGDFSDIRVVAKHAARLGQCFSTTRAINGSNVEVKTVEDIERNGFVFTDGVGKISPFLAQLITSELDLPSVPSVFQFRLGGCKGVLAVNPALKLKEVHIRPSQYKFAAAHNGLEIIIWSQYAGAALNRQLILVLSALGVLDVKFVEKQREMLTTLEQAMTDNKKAIKLLQKYVDPNQMTITIAGLLSDGFMTSKDPFVLSIMRLWRSWSVKYLKEKAKILIEQGAFVLGCIDETGKLRGSFGEARDTEGPIPVDALPEIFIQISDREDQNRKKVIEGICLLARNPSLHPGDIRVVRAVDIPALHHLYDCVVLPQTGDRDLASMCSGGDLNGDDYLVMWDSDLIPTLWNHEPMNYRPPKALTLDRDVTVDDITSFFVTYMKNDRLGSIATAHRAFADLSQYGVMDARCLELAELHSKAVDYVKTGQPAKIKEELHPRKWPHWMEKAHLSQEKIYHSDKVLGQLYDQVERVDFVPDFDSPFDERILKAYDLSEEALEAAEQVKEEYDRAIRRIMAQHEIKTEYEVWSTFVLKQSTVGDYKLHELMGEISSSLKDRFRKACYEKIGTKDRETLAPFVAAMYTVTQRQTAHALEECKQIRIPGVQEVPVRFKHVQSMPLISFPWLFPSVLGRIANGTLRHTVDVEIPEEAGTAPKRHGMKKDQMKDHAAEDLIVKIDGDIKHRGDLLELFEDAGHGPAPNPSHKPLHEEQQLGSLMDDFLNGRDATVDHVHVMQERTVLLDDGEPSSDNGVLTPNARTSEENSPFSSPVSTPSDNSSQTGPKPIQVSGNQDKPQEPVNKNETTEDDEEIEEEIVLDIREGPSAFEALEQLLG